MFFGKQTSGRDGFTGRSFSHMTSGSSRIAMGHSVSPIPLDRIPGFFPVGDAAGVPAYMFVPTLGQKMVRVLAGGTRVPGAVDHDLVIRI